MHFLITGGTGFVGRRLVGRLLNEGHEVTVYSRQSTKEVRGLLSHRVKPVRSLDLVNSNSVFDAVVNLAGEGIADKRWSQARKKVLLDSRINTTRELIAVMERLNTKPKAFISASAVGYYGMDHGTTLLDEAAPAGTGFAASLCARWENEAKKAESLGIRTCLVRIATVMHPEGGALQKLLPVFRLGLGGSVGSGLQMFPWIHMDDLHAALLFLATNEQCSGPFNAVAPERINYKQFSHALGKALRRPALIPTPAFALQLLMGESASLITHGQALEPTNLTAAGFEFNYPKIGNALKALLGYLRS